MSTSKNTCEHEGASVDAIYSIPRVTQKRMDEADLFPLWSLELMYNYRNSFNDVLFFFQKQKI